MSKGASGKPPRDREERTTRKYTASPWTAGGEDEVTAPIDMREMEATARLSKLVPDPPESAPPVGSLRPRAVIEVPGRCDSCPLQVQNVSMTGVALEVPPNLLLDLGEGARVTVRFRSAGASGRADVVLRVPARMAHQRRGRSGASGGLALRWDPATPEEKATVDRLLRILRPSRGRAPRG